MNGEFYLAWLRARLDAARTLPPDALLLIIVIELLLLINFIVAEVNAGRRAGVFKEENAALAAEVLTVRRALDTERRWRLAAEKAVAEAVRPVSIAEPAPAPATESTTLSLSSLAEQEFGSYDIAQEEFPQEEITPPAARAPLEALPPRELHELLERENRDPIQPASPAAIARVEAVAADEPAPPPAAAKGGRKAAPAKTKSARNAAKVANLINRTIFE